jgi:hypothetical protein
MKGPIDPRKKKGASDSAALAKTTKKLETLSAKKPKTSIGRGINTMRTMATRTKLEKQESFIKPKKK